VVPRAQSSVAGARPGPEAEPCGSAIDHLYREQHAFVWRNARRLGCADEWVDDAVQEVFLVAARRLSELSAESNLRGWLFAIVFRVAQRMQRGRARYRTRVQRYAETQADALTPSHEGSSQAARQLRDLLSRLDEAKRVVVILTELEGMTSVEVAAVMSVPQGTVDSRLRAARKQLREMIEHDRSLPEGPTR
jgi:RNA polymerase sigma-70 factor, ECF subfamily